MKTYYQKYFYRKKHKSVKKIFFNFIQFDSKQWRKAKLRKIRQINRTKIYREIEIEIESEKEKV